MFKGADRAVFSIDLVDIRVMRNVTGVDWFQNLHLWCVRCGEKKASDRVSDAWSDTFPTPSDALSDTFSPLVRRVRNRV